MAMIKRGVQQKTISAKNINLPVNATLTMENLWTNGEFYLMENKLYVVTKDENSVFQIFCLLSNFLDEGALIEGVFFMEEVEYVMLPSKPEVVMSYTFGVEW